MSKVSKIIRVQNNVLPLLLELVQFIQSPISLYDNFSLTSERKICRSQDSGINGPYLDSISEEFFPKLLQLIKLDTEVKVPDFENFKIEDMAYTVNPLYVSIGIHGFRKMGTGDKSDNLQRVTYVLTFCFTTSRT